MFMPPVFPAHWHVSQPVLIADTFSSLVWKVSLPDGTPAIVKGLKPIEDIADELRGADYLVWRNGRGAVRLLGRENNLMLLEYAGERMLSHIVAEHGDYQATEIAAELMAKLYAASEEPLPSALLPIRDRFAALFQRARDDQNAGCQTDYVHAAIIADQMMSNASELRGLHGDLHHENIMFSSRGWLVIDPVGLVGEVGFGAANMFYDPADRDDLCLDPRRIAQMADAFSRALDVDPRRLLDQAYAYGCLSAAWNADGEEEQRDRAPMDGLHHRPEWPQAAGLPAACRVRQRRGRRAPVRGPEPLNFWATSDLVDLVKQRIEITDGKLKAAFVINRAIKGTKIGAEIRKALEEYDLPVLESVIFQRVSYPSSASMGKTVTELEPSSDGAKEIISLTNEILTFLEN